MHLHYCKKTSLKAPSLFSLQFIWRGRPSPPPNNRRPEVFNTIGTFVKRKAAHLIEVELIVINFGSSSVTINTWFLSYGTKNGGQIVCVWNSLHFRAGAVSLLWDLGNCPSRKLNFTLRWWEMYLPNESSTQIWHVASVNFAQRCNIVWI